MSVVKSKARAATLGAYRPKATLPARPRETAEQRAAYSAKVLHAAGLIDLPQLRAVLRKMAAIADRAPPG